MKNNILHFQSNALNNESTTAALDLTWLDLHDSSLYPSIFSPDNDNTYPSSTSSSLLLLPHIIDPMHITSTGMWLFVAFFIFSSQLNLIFRNHLEDDPVTILSSTTNAANIPNDTLETTTQIDCQSSSLYSLSTDSSVVSMLMMGSIAEHDRPFAEYGHLGRC